MAQTKASNPDPLQGPNKNPPVMDVSVFQCPQLILPPMFCAAAAGELGDPRPPSWLPLHLPALRSVRWGPAPASVHPRDPGPSP